VTVVVAVTATVPRLATVAVAVTAVTVTG
jgi:hypothetical protein